MIPMEETAKAAAESIRPIFLPTVSLSQPANVDPIRQPMSAQEATQPFMAGVRLNFSSMYPIAPEITAVS